MRRRRRTKYTWLPAYGTGTPIAGVGNYEGVQRFGTLGVLANAEPAVGVIAVLPDAPPENFDASTTSLSNAINSEYILRRIVGKLHIAYRQSNQPYSGAGNDVPPIPEAALVTAGFFVARCSDVSQTDPEAYPIGFLGGVNIQDFNNYSPMARDTQREPWIWRRSWILGNNRDRFLPVDNSLTFYDQGWETFPPNNSLQGSVLDGPHIDAKTVRRVGQDERLWFALATQCISSHGPASDNGSLTYVLDVRYLGALRKARQRGAF